MAGLDSITPEDLPEIPSESVASPTLPPVSDLARGRILMQQQIERLSRSLDKRLNPPFDPMMMKVASGFLKPTKTGGFGESLGYAAEGAAEQAEKDIARRSEIEKLKLELAQKSYDLASEAEAYDLLTRAASGQLGPQAKKVADLSVQSTSGSTGAAKPSEGGGAGVTLNVKPAEAVQMVQENPNVMDKITMTPEIVGAIGAINKKYGEVAKTIYEGQMKRAELETKRYTTNAQGDVWDNFEGKWIEKGSRSVEVASPFDPDRTMKMPSDLVKEYNKLDFNNPSLVNSWLQQHGLGAYAIGKGGEGTPSGGNAPAGGTKLEKETESRIKEKRAGSDIEQDTKDKASISTAADAAIDIKNNARAVYSYAANPKTAGAFGILAKPGMSNAFFKALEEPLRIGDISVGIANVEDVIRTGGGTQAEIDAAKAVARNISQLELGFSQAFKGQGQVSDNERRIVQRVGPAISDSPKVMMLKSELITARATFDAENAARYQAWARTHPNDYVRDYKQSPEYKSLRSHYDAKLNQVENKYMPKEK